MSKYCTLYCTSKFCSKYSTDNSVILLELRRLATQVLKVALVIGNVLGIVDFLLYLCYVGSKALFYQLPFCEGSAQTTISRYANSLNYYAPLVNSHLFPQFELFWSQ